MEWQQTGRWMLAGAFGFLALVEIWFLVSRQSRRHLWGALASGLVVVFLGARAVSHSGADEIARILALQLECASLLLLAGVGLQVMARATASRWRGLSHVLVVMAVTLAGLCFVDGVLIEHRIVELPGAFGTQWIAAPMTTLGWALRGTFMMAFVGVVVVLGGELRKKGFRAQLRVARFAGVLIVLAVINDRLGAAGVFPTIALLEVGLASFGITVAAALAQSTDRAFRLIEADVEARTVELEQALESLDGLLSALPNIVFVVRADGVQPFNEAAHFCWNASREDRLTLEGIGASERDVALLRGLADDERVVHHTRVRLRDASGRVFPCEVAAVKAMIRGEEVVIADARDVSEREQMEQRVRLADRLGSTGTLAAGIAHEINNPLTYVASNIAYVRENVAPGSDLGEALDDAAAGVSRVTQIVQELRQFGGADVKSTNARTPLGRPLRFALRLTKHVLRHSCEVVTRFDDDELPPVHGDDGRLSQVFVNLLTNAADAMPSQRSAAANRVVVEPKVGPRFIEVFVRDNGRGMTPEEVEHVFDPYYVGGAEEGGTHLGLSIAHGMVEQLGGEMHVESELGVGTTVRVRLARSEPAAQSVRQPTPTPATAGALRVLLVDDEPNVLRAMDRLLSRTFDVVTISSGHAAVELFRAGEMFDAVLCDMMMPKMTGHDVLVWLQEHRPELASRFAIVTGGAVGRDKAAFLEQAHVPVLNKPLAQADIVATIERLAE